MRLWDGGAESPAAAIKIVRHNLLRPTALIHEAGHQVAHIVGWNRELAETLDAGLRDAPTSWPDAWSSWASEIAADAFAFVHTGYASVAALHDVLAGEGAFVFQHTPRDPHPICYLRVLLGVETCRYFYGAGPVGCAGRVVDRRLSAAIGARRARGRCSSSRFRCCRDRAADARHAAARVPGPPLRALIQPERVSPAGARPRGSASGRRSTRPCTGCGPNACECWR